MEICRFQKACWFRERCRNFHDHSDLEYWKKIPRKNRRGKRNNRKETKRKETTYQLKLSPNKTKMVKEYISEDDEEIYLK